MANVITHPHPQQLGFHSRPVNHSPSPLGFGFGLSSPAVSSWTTGPNHSTWATHSQIPTPGRSSKRRHEDDEADTPNKHARDDAMERSPTPERPKRAAPKRARTTMATILHPKDSHNDKNTSTSSNSENDVDVGVLLASLPQQSLLPLLNSLITTHPSLKPTILSLIPRPSLDTAIQAIISASRKLHDAYPYSNGEQSTSFGFTPGISISSRAGGFGSTGFGFGQPSSFGQQNPLNSGGMREEYIVSRLRPHITDFVSACTSYLPYFSYISASHDTSTHVQAPSHTQSHAAALQSQHKDKSHPSETFQFLYSLTTEILSQPTLTQSSLVPLLLPRLADEWRAWVNRVDEVVNRQHGMFGKEVVESWERGLDEFAQAKGNGLEAMQAVRDQWVSKVGWLVGRQPMEEL